MCLFLQGLVHKLNCTMGHRTHTNRSLIIWWIVMSLAGKIIAKCSNNKTCALSASILHLDYFLPCRKRYLNISILFVCLVYFKIEI